MFAVVLECDLKPKISLNYYEFTDNRVIKRKKYGYSS